MADEIVLDAQIQFTHDSQPVFQQQIIVLMNAASLGIFDRNHAGVRLLALDALENEVERFARQQFDILAEEPARCNFAIGSTFALKGDPKGLSFRHVSGLRESLRLTSSFRGNLVRKSLPDWSIAPTDCLEAVLSNLRQPPSPLRRS